MTALLTAPSARKIEKAIRTKATFRPTWEIAEWFPLQGCWSVEDYFALTDKGVRAEFVNGYVEFMEMPTILHDRIVKFLFLALHAFVEKKKLGEVFISTTKIMLREKEVRMPDVFFISKEHLNRHTEDCFDVAQLVMKVVSPDFKSHQRDLTIKRKKYAEAGVPEYWIVDPEQGRISVLQLKGKNYVVHGSYKVGSKAESVFLKGFDVSVKETLSGQKL